MSSLAEKKKHNIQKGHTSNELFLDLHLQLQGHKLDRGLAGVQLF